MSAVDMRFEGGSIPSTYDTYLGPVSFTPYAKLLVQHCDLAALPAKTVLEVGCGTGRLTSELLLVLPTASITATDISEGMMQVAKSRISSPSVVWKQADLMSIPFADASFDLVVSSFTYMLVSDFGKAFAEARRVLQPSGSFVFSVWDKSPFFDVLTQTIVEYLPEEAAAKVRAMGAVPYTLNDTSHTTALLTSAGFAEVKCHHAGIVTTDIPSLTRGLLYGTPFAAPFGEDQAAMAACYAKIQERMGSAVESSALFYHATA